MSDPISPDLCYSSAMRHDPQSNQPIHFPISATDHLGESREWRQNVTYFLKEHQGGNLLTLYADQRRYILIRMLE